MSTTKNIKYGSGKPTSEAEGKSIKKIAMEPVPGVLVNDNYKRGKDKALDAVLDKLNKNPKSLDSSGMGSHWKV